MASSHADPLGYGLISIGVAAAFMIRQRDYKRMLAYSSVEHMGSSRSAWASAASHYAALLHM